MGKLQKYTAGLLPSRRGKSSPATSSGRTSEDHPEKKGSYDDAPIPYITIHSFIMGVFVSMGGFIFGYDTGQISGFLGMQAFLERFGELDENGVWYFSNVRSGLIVGLVSWYYKHVTCLD